MTGGELFLKNTYESPFNSRYASKEMLEIFSPDMKFKTWRRLWIALAEAEKELGLNITAGQIDEMKSAADNINYDLAEEKEKLFKHDVMAHIYAYGEQCPKARAIIHLGATSCYVGDNTDIILMREGLLILRTKTLEIIKRLAEFAIKFKDLPALGYTHLQPAQPVTVGKRACLWIHDLMMDVSEIDFALKNMKLLGSKGTTGTQASFLALFDGNHEKVSKLDSMIADKMGFDSVYPVSGQTYSRKVDTRILNVLAGLAQSAHKFSNDIRLLQSMKEISEPFGENQVGSSAMAYKRNPMRCERMASLSRYIITNVQNAAITAASQWLERTLDDSANRRISVSEGFLATDAVLEIYLDVSSGLKVYPAVISRHLKDELPFMATENILMEAVKRGGDRQALHERIRIHSMAAANLVMEQGKENDLIERISSDDSFRMTSDEIESIMNPENFTGRASKQVDEFIAAHVMPLLAAKN